MTIKVYRVGKEAYNQVRQAVATDHFAKHDYKLKDAKALSIDIDAYFLYVDADDEFFKEHGKELEIEGVEEVTGNEYDNVVNAIKAEDSSVATGIALFD